jgi:hypothetical protein
MAQQPLVDQAFRIILRCTHSVGLLWTSDQPDAETSTCNTQHSQEKNIHAPAGFEPETPVIERPQTHALDRAATGLALYVRK